jgi:hypothetical protein
MQISDVYDESGVVAIAAHALANDFLVLALSVRSHMQRVAVKSGI